MLDLRHTCRGLNIPCLHGLSLTLLSLAGRVEQERACASLSWSGRLFAKTGTDAPWLQHCSLLVLPLLTWAIWQLNSSSITAFSFASLYSFEVLVPVKQQLYFLVCSIEVTVCQFS